MKQLLTEAAFPEEPALPSPFGPSSAAGAGLLLGTLWQPSFRPGRCISKSFRFGRIGLPTWLWAPRHRKDCIHSLKKTDQCCPSHCSALCLQTVQYSIFFQTKYSKSCQNFMTFNKRTKLQPSRKRKCDTTSMVFQPPISQFSNSKKGHIATCKKIQESNI